MEEEERLADPAIGESFIERVCTARRWRAFVARRPWRRDLIAFHIDHEYAVRVHSPAHYIRLGRLVTARLPLTAALPSYGSLLMQALSIPATRSRHLAVVRGLAGLLKRDLGVQDRRQLRGVVDAYRRGCVPLLAPWRCCVTTSEAPARPRAAHRVYLDSYPTELLLRSSA